MLMLVIFLAAVATLFGRKAAAMIALIAAVLYAIFHLG
jgi:hypothetical protein